MPVLMLASFARRIGFSAKNSLRGTLAIMISIITAWLVSILKRVEPKSLWWLAAAGIIIFHPLYYNITPVDALLAPLTVLIMVLIFSVVESKQRSFVSWLGLIIAIGIALSTRIHFALIFIAPALCLLTYYKSFKYTSIMALDSLVVAYILNPLLWFTPQVFLKAAFFDQMGFFTGSALNNGTLYLLLAHCPTGRLIHNGIFHEEIMNTLPRPRPFVMIILDGWGVSLKGTGNAIEAANTPNMDKFTWYYPSASLVASGLEVGLPASVAGNSETGHRNIGAGSVQYQIMAHIDHAIEDRSFFNNEVLLKAVRHASVNDSDLHLMGLVSTGGVHSHSRHLFALLQFLHEQNFRDRVFIHMFTDGRDTPPRSAAVYLKQLQEVMQKFGIGTIVSVTGRLSAMDRNENWERTQATYDMLTGNMQSAGAPTPEIAISQAYAQGLIDEKIPTTTITNGGAPIALIKDNDAVIFFNYRPDRARQLTKAFVTPNEVGFKLTPKKKIYFATLNEYDKRIPAPAAFSEDAAQYPLARVLSESSLKQLHIAESEKYAHITYYLNVGHEKPFPGEVHDLVHSSKTKDWSKRPKMKAAIITKRLTSEIAKGEYDVYFVNFANPDMVGHTGNFDATMTACAFVDECLGKIYEAVQKLSGAMIITADHGKAEAVSGHEAHQLFTEHTKNPVPLIYIREELRQTTKKSDARIFHSLSNPIGVLADVAPTVLDILNLEKPTAMTGISLLGSIK